MKHLLQSDAIEAYLQKSSLREAPILAKLREYTEFHHQQSQMMSTPVQAQFLAFLVELIGARRAIEVGVFTGYSTLAIAQTLPVDGKVVACDISKQDTDIGAGFWKEAGVLNKIELRIAPALDTLQSLIDEGKARSFDFIFIDADKKNYQNYYHLSLELLRTGGLMVIDNVLAITGALVQDRDKQSTKMLADFNAFVHQDQRVGLSMLPIGLGMTMVRKRN